MKETWYMFKVDSQYRICLNENVRKIYSFEKEVYLKLQVIDGQKYIQISGKAIEFFHSLARMDKKGRFVIPKEVREKLDIECGDRFDSYEDEVDSKSRTLLLRKQERVR